MEPSPGVEPVLARSKRAVIAISPRRQRLRRSDSNRHRPVNSRLPYQLGTPHQMWRPRRDSNPLGLDRQSSTSSLRSRSLRSQRPPPSPGLYPGEGRLRVETPRINLVEPPGAAPGTGRCERPVILFHHDPDLSSRSEASPGVEPGLGP